MRRHVAGWVLASWAVGVSGCQSWSQIGQGMPSGTRVAPPGTGTYPVPQSYYNNGAAPKSGAVSTTQPTGSTGTATARTASQTLPSTATTPGAPGPAMTAAIPTVDQMRAGVNNTASAVFDDLGSRANQVVQASTARAASAVEKYTDPAPSLRPAGAPLSSPPAASLAATSPAQSNQAPANSAATRSLSDDSTAEEPQLDWQAPQ